MTADRVRWEHIQRVFEQCDRNVSETRAGCACTVARCSASSASTPRAPEPAAAGSPDHFRQMRLSAARAA